MHLFVMGQVTGYDWFYELFLSSEPWGYFGPFALIFVGFLLVKKDYTLGLIWFIVECLFLANYFTLVEATPQYWWHIIIILLGGVVVFAFALTNRRR